MPFETLLHFNCGPLLDRCLAQDFVPPQSPESSFYDDVEYKPAKSGCYELYIPAPPTAEPAQALLYHIATRNFFAWLLRKPLVGHHLGGTLVTLLNSMNDFRAMGSNTVQDFRDYMDDQGYTNMTDQPDYALAILYFAEHFQFTNFWMDAYAHCVRMYEVLPQSAEYEVSLLY